VGSGVEQHMAQERLAGTTACGVPEKAISVHVSTPSRQSHSVIRG
jgi:hypothetical protein